MQQLISFSENQIQDLLVLRRLFLGRLGTLLSECKNLMWQIAQYRESADLHHWAACLERNITEEHQTYLQNSTVQYLGVRTFQPGSVNSTCILSQPSIH